MAEAGIPWTTLRATQFHDLTLLTVAQMAKMPVIPVPSGFAFQPIDAGGVATRLVELGLGRPFGLAPDLAGPRVFTMDELVRSYLQATHRRPLTVPVRVPGKAAAAPRAGANLNPSHAVGQRTCEDFLADRLATGPTPAAARDLA